MARSHKTLGYIASTLIRPADTNAYAQNDLIASSVTAGSVIVPNFGKIQGSTLNYEFFEIMRGILLTDIVAGFTTAQFHIDLWSAAPTFTNGDNGAYAVATGSQGYLGCLTTEVSSAYRVSGDGAFLDVKPGNAFTAGASTESIQFPVNDAAAIFWSMREIDATGFTPKSAQHFTLRLFGNVE